MKRAEGISAAEYAPDDLQRVRQTCLTLATYLGSFRDDLVIVGGLVPSLLISPEKQAANNDRHVGTQELDLGLSVAILDDNRYAELSQQLRTAGFEPDQTSQGKDANHRWKHRDKKVTVDFLIGEAGSGPRSGNMNVRQIDDQFSAVIAEAIPLAFRDRVEVVIDDRTLANETVKRSVWVCGPGAFIVLKAHAMRNRGKNKDAYDLFFMLRSYGDSYADVAAALRPLLAATSTQRALDILREDFATPSSIGPSRAAAFVGRLDDEDYKADLAGAVVELLRLLAETPES